MLCSLYWTTVSEGTMCLCCPLFINCVVHLYYCHIHLYCNYQLLIWCAHGWEAAEIIQISHNLVFSIFFGWAASCLLTNLLTTSCENVLQEAGTRNMQESKSKPARNQICLLALFFYLLITVTHIVIYSSYIHIYIVIYIIYI